MAPGFPSRRSYERDPSLDHASPRPKGHFCDVVGAELFRALGHPVRVRVLELLRARKEMSVRELHAALQIDAGSVSQHLGALRRQRLLATRRQGTSVYYRVPDPRTFRLLDLARQALASQVRYTQALLEGLNQAEVHRDGTLRR